MKCLIVDDSDFFRDLFTMFLADHAEIETAENGREAAELFCQAMDDGIPFDLVLLDVVMPEMDGQDSLRLMRQGEQERKRGAEQKAVIIMTTALTSAEQMQQALWDGDCTDYLVKPVGRDDLLAMLRRYGLLQD